MGTRKPSEYRRFLKERCEKCSFSSPDVPLEIHHKDRDKTNNDPSNLETLCPNCHKGTHKRIGGGQGRPKGTKGPPKIIFKKRVTAHQKSVLEALWLKMKSGEIRVT